MEDKSNYHQIYYAAHPELREKAKERERQKRALAKAQAAQSSMKKSKPSQVQPAFSISKNYTLTMAITFFIASALLTTLLLREMTHFYAETDGVVYGFIKSFGLEFLVFACSSFSFLKWGHKIFAAFLILSISTFSVYAMSAKQLAIGLSTTRLNQTTLEAIADVKIGIEEKGRQRDLYLEKGWISAARKTEAVIDDMRKELTRLRSTLIETQSDQATFHSVMTQIVLRILMMLGNIFSAQILGVSLKVLESFKNQNELSTGPLKVSSQVLKFQKPKNPLQSGLKEFSLKAFKDSGRRFEMG